MWCCRPRPFLMRRKPHFRDVILGANGIGTSVQFGLPAKRRAPVGDATRKRLAESTRKLHEHRRKREEELRKIAREGLVDLPPVGNIDARMRPIDDMAARVMMVGNCTPRDARIAVLAVLKEVSRV